MVKNSLEDIHLLESSSKYINAYLTIECLKIADFMLIIKDFSYYY